MAGGATLLCSDGERHHLNFCFVLLYSYHRKVRFYVWKREKEREKEKELWNLFHPKSHLNFTKMILIQQKIFFYYFEISGNVIKLMRKATFQNQTSKWNSFWHKSKKIDSNFVKLSLWNHWTYDKLNTIFFNF